MVHTSHMLSHGDLQLDIWNLKGTFVYDHAYVKACSYMFDHFFLCVFVFCRRSTTTIPTVPSGTTLSGAWWDTGPLRAVNCWKPTRATPLAPAVTWPTSPSSWLIGGTWWVALASCLQELFFFFLVSVSCSSSISLTDLCTHGKNKSDISVEIIRLLPEEKVRVGIGGGWKQAVTLKERDCGSG